MDTIPSIRRSAWQRLWLLVNALNTKQQSGALGYRSFRWVPRRKIAIVGQLLSIYYRKNLLQESIRTNPFQSEWYCKGILRIQIVEKTQRTGMLFTSSSSCLTTLLFAVLSWLPWLMWLWPLELHTSCMMWCIPLYEGSVVWFHWFFFFFVFSSSVGDDVAYYCVVAPLFLTCRHVDSRFGWRFTLFEPRSPILRRSNFHADLNRDTRLHGACFCFCVCASQSYWELSVFLLNSRAQRDLTVWLIHFCAVLFVVMSLSVLAMPSVCCPLCGWTFSDLPKQILVMSLDWFLASWGFWGFFACGTFYSWRTFELKFSWHALFIANKYFDSWKCTKQHCTWTLTPNTASQAKQCMSLGVSSLMM